MELLTAAIAAFLACIAIVLFILAYRIYKIPNHIWEANRKYPCTDNLQKVLGYI